jgi:hypothetical protein
MRRLGMYVDQDYEIASAIAVSATDDPLWDDEAGADRTAAVLLVLAVTTSGLMPSRVSHDGCAFGLYQIPIPDRTFPADMLLHARPASRVAIELPRRRLTAPGDAPLDARLAWHNEGPWRGAERVAMAQQLLAQP